MPEKTIVTIDCDLIIPEGEEKVFENQHIRLEAGIECKGTLIFKSCTIEPCTNLERKRGRNGGNGRKPACKPRCISMGIDGKLEMDECEVIHPGDDFLSSWNMIIKNTSFLISPCPDNGIGLQSVLTPCVIAAHGEAKISDCSFVEEAGNSSQTSNLDLIRFELAKIENCTFKNITGKIDVDTITDCSFTGCADIGGVDISGSTFTDCKSVTADGGYFKNCDFIRVKGISALDSDIENCRFQKIRGDVEDDGVVFLDDGKVTHCSFDDVELRNSSYLIKGFGNSCVECCQFTNCRTDREDLAICHGEVETGKLRKRWVEVDILDESTCSGHDAVEQLD